MHLAVWDVLHENKSVTHNAGGDYDYDNDQDKEMYEEGFGIEIPGIAPKEVPVFNVEIENALYSKRCER